MRSEISNYNIKKYKLNIKYHNIFIQWNFFLMKNNFFWNNDLFFFSFYYQTEIIWRKYAVQCKPIVAKASLKKAYGLSTEPLCKIKVGDICTVLFSISNVRKWSFWKWNRRRKETSYFLVEDNCITIVKFTYLLFSTFFLFFFRLEMWIQIREFFFFQGVKNMESSSF